MASASLATRKATSCARLRVMMFSMLTVIHRSMFMCAATTVTVAACRFFTNINSELWSFAGSGSVRAFLVSLSFLTNINSEL